LKNKKREKNNKEKVHIHAVTAARYEGALLWQIFSVFLLIHTAVSGIIMQGIDSSGICKDLHNHVAKGSCATFLLHDSHLSGLTKITFTDS